MLCNPTDGRRILCSCIRITCPRFTDSELAGAQLWSFHSYGEYIILESMPPKRVISKEMIISNAFELVREHGYLELTARNLAERIGCSTMPIYSQIENMQGLERKVAEESLKLLLEYQFAQSHEPVALSLALGLLRFIIKERELAKIMFFNDDPKQSENRREMRTCAEEEIQKYILTECGQPRSGMEAVSSKVKSMQLYAFGLAAAVLFGTVKLTEDDAVRMLREYYRLLT